MKREVLRTLGMGCILPEPAEDSGTACSTEAIVQAVAERDGIKVMPTRAYAENVTGLSTQVPMRIAYQTDGRSRTIRIPRARPEYVDRTIRLRRTSARYMNARTEIGYLVIQGLRSHGRQYFGKKEYAELSRRLPPAAKRELLQDLDTAPAWIADIMRRLAAEAA